MTCNFSVEIKVEYKSFKIDLFIPVKFDIICLEGQRKQYLLEQISYSMQVYCGLILKNALLQKSS